MTAFNTNANRDRRPAAGHSIPHGMVYPRLALAATLL